AMEHVAVALDGERGWQDAQVEPLALGERRELDAEAREDLVERDIATLGVERAGVEPRDVEQRAQEILDEAQRGVNLGHELERGAGAARLALEERRDIKPRRVQRLQQVVARRGEEPRLAEIRRLGHRFGAA